MRRTLLVLSIVIIFLSSSIPGCLKKADDEGEIVEDTFIFELDEKNIEVRFSVSDGMIRTYEKGEWKEVLVKGVNLGMGKPGYFPGEAAITKDEYARWIEQIGEMNANTIRVYTIHPPGFYEALNEYNERSMDPIYLIHGVWLNDETYHSHPSVFEDTIENEFKDSMKLVADVVHGNVVIEKEPGHSHGQFTADVSKYLMGYIIGVEWDPIVVSTTNDLEEGHIDQHGKYLDTNNASPFEIWLGGMMEHIIDYETDEYGQQRPVSFVNWVTTDKLSHPSEPLQDEDLVSIDPDRITSTEDHFPGLFGSYQIYPYYPDLLNYDRNYTNYIDHRGERNSYAGYLNDLRSSHDIPLLVAEFGIPSSRGMTHRNVNGLNQGNMTEDQQGEALVHMFEDIIHEDYAGGILFSWQDEWFKRTWNTMDLMDPDRRPYWHDVQTCEQNFGLLSFDPGGSTRILIDGRSDDWYGLPSDERTFGDIDQGPASRLMITSDETYLYIGMEFQDGSIDWEEESFHIYLDTVDGMGITTPNDDKIYFSSGMEFRIDIQDRDGSKIMVDSHYDMFYYQYAEELSMMDELEYPKQPDNGIFHDIHYCVNKPTYLPEQEVLLPLDKFDTGHLKWGNSDPISPYYDSNADILGPGEDPIIEMRIPWLLLNFKDPSRRMITGDIWTDGLKAEVKKDGIKFALVTHTKEEGKILISSTFPERKNDQIGSDDMLLHSWEEWDLPIYHERLKTSYNIVKDCLADQPR